jgi:hypothetical protein
MTDKKGHGKAKNSKDSANHCEALRPRTNATPPKPPIMAIKAQKRARVMPEVIVA